MPTDLENLIARRSAVIAELAALASGRPGGNPNSQAAGIDHVGYKKALYDELTELDRLIGVLDGPIEEISTGFSR